MEFIKIVDDGDVMQSLGHLIKRWRPDKARQFLLNELSPTRLDHVAIDNGEVIGWIRGHHRQDYIWKNLVEFAARPEGWVCSYVSEMFVHPSWRRKGMGSLLIEGFMREVQEANNNAVILLMDQSSEELKDGLPKFYGANGFYVPEMVKYRSDLLVRKL